MLYMELPLRGLKPIAGPADGTSGITGALAALTQYFSTSPNVTPQTDCGLDLGWTHPNATNSAKSINNTAVCLGAIHVGLGLRDSIIVPWTYM